MDINDLDYEDEEQIVDNPQNEQQEEIDKNEEFVNEDESSALEDFLASKGISDLTQIKFENEDTKEIESKSWYDLSKEEQLNILSSGDEEVEDNDLDEDEIDLINRIRLSKMSIEDYLAYERQKGVTEYVNSQTPYEPSYIVDDYSDDDLFKLDLLAKIGEDNITDEELEQALQNAKSNETIFNKQIQGLREEYKRLEEEKTSREEAERNQIQQEQFEQYSNSVINSINNFNSLGELDVSMEDADKQQLYTFLTGQDPAGVSYLSRALQDPDTLVRMAWFALNGEDIINSISDYYKQTISEVSKNNYKKGFEDAKSGKTAPVVVNKQQKTSRKKITTINDLY